MNLDELKEAIREAIKNAIPFDLPAGMEFSLVEQAVSDVAKEMGYVKAYPHEFNHKAWAFHLSSNVGLRWGYVSNDNKVGWFEGRETTPIPERDRVIRDEEPVYGQDMDLVKPVENR